MQQTFHNKLFHESITRSYAIFAILCIITFACHHPRETNESKDCTTMPSFHKNQFIGTVAHGREIFSPYHNEGPSVAVLDLDHDGRLEVLQCFDFETMWVYGYDTTYTLDIPCGAMAVVDINKDGWEDLISEKSNSASNRGHELVVWENQRGTLLQRSSVPLYRDQVHAIRIADFNADGFPDIFAVVLGTNPVQTDWNRVFYGTDSWEFQPADYPLYSAGKSFDAGIGDYNNDGFMDVVVANDRGSQFGGDELLWNTDGILTVDSDCNCVPTQSAMGMDVADVNHDGILDIVTGDVVRLYLLQGTGDGFVDITLRSNANQMDDIEMGWGIRLIDIENDGDVDIFSAQGDHTYPDITNPEYEGDLPLSILLQEDGMFQEQPDNSVFDQMGSFRSVVPLHWNADGVLDYWITDVEKPPTLWISDTCTTGNWLYFTGQIGTAIRLTVQQPDTEESATTEVWYGELQNSSSYGASIQANWHVGLGNKVVTQIHIRFPHFPNENWLLWSDNPPLNEYVYIE